MKNFPQKSFGIMIDDLIIKSLEIIQSVAEHAPLTVAFSGGKDSIVLEHLVRVSGVPYRLIYHDTTIDPPDVRAFIKRNYPGTAFIRPGKTFWEHLLINFPPSVLKRWCCREIKHGLDHSKITLTGVRAEESPKRKKYTHVDYIKKQDKINVQPILEWPEWAIWEYIHTNGLPYPDIYAVVDRVGCVICPFRGYKLHQIWRARYPNYYKTFEKYFVAWLAGKFDLHNYRVDDAITDWYKLNGKVYYEKYQKPIILNHPYSLGVPLSPKEMGNYNG